MDFGIDNKMQSNHRTILCNAIQLTDKIANQRELEFYSRNHHVEISLEDHVARRRESGLLTQARAETQIEDFHVGPQRNLYVRQEKHW